MAAPDLNGSQSGSAAAGQLDLSVSREGGCVTVAVGGEVDLATTPRLADALEQGAREAPDAIVVDLQSCAFMDSSGLALLVRTAQRHGRAPRVLLARAGGQVRRTLEISGIDRALPVYESVAEAVAAALADPGAADGAAAA